jgi:AcrR family transcriptional regulator
MPNLVTEPWLRAGYGLFAHEGLVGLKVEVLARLVGKSKSSFYHHFADVEVFTELLLAYHLQQATHVADRERRCRRIDPELIEVLLDVKSTLLFDRQLRIHRHVPAFRQCFDQTTRLTIEAFATVWAAEMGLANRPDTATDLLVFAVENFYAQLTEELLTYKGLSAYFGNIQSLVGGVRKAAA